MSDYRIPSASALGFVRGTIPLLNAIRLSWHISMVHRHAARNLQTQSLQLLDVSMPPHGPDSSALGVIDGCPFSLFHLPR